MMSVLPSLATPYKMPTSISSTTPIKLVGTQIIVQLLVVKPLQIQILTVKQLMPIINYLSSQSSMINIRALLLL